MSNIFDQIKEVYKSPELNSKLMMKASTDSLHDILKTRQTIRLTMEQFEELVKTPGLLFYDSDLTQVDDIQLDDEIDLSNIEDGFSVSEYVGGYEKYLIHPYYIKYAKENNTDVLVSIYGAENLCNLNRRPKMIQDQVNLHSVLSLNKDIVLPDYEFKIPNTIHYTEFACTKYESGVLVPSLQDPIHVISVNIPYNYYRYQPLIPGVYNVDLDKGYHVFGDMNPSQFEELYDDIVKNGIREPLFLRMDGETLSSPDTRTNVILLIAKILKIPSIPANVYLSNEDIVSNRMIDSIVNIDESIQNMICKSTEYMFHIFDPYILLYKVEDPSSAIVKANDKEYNVAFYKIFKDIGHVKVRYFDTSVNPDILKDNNKEIEDIAKQLEDEAKAKLSNDINEVIASLSSEE